MGPGFQMTIGKGLGGVGQVNAAFAEFAEAHALPATVRRSVNVALDELLANTVSYGLAGQAAGEVTVGVELGPDRLTVTLTDNGLAFDPFDRAAPDTGLSVEDRPIGGLGIHLVRELMDDVSYQRRADRNVIVLAKLLAGRQTVGSRRGILMDITTRSHGDATVVKITGNLDSNTSPQAQQALDAALASGSRKIAIDCTALDYISSAGLRVLLGTAKKLGGVGGGLRLFGLNETVKEVFDISGFSTILAVYPAEAEALSLF